jgi:uncharacterized protein YceK
LKKLLLSLILIITLVGCSTIKDVNNNSTKEVDEFDLCSGTLNVTFRVIDTLEVKDE